MYVNVRTKREKTIGMTPMFLKVAKKKQCVHRCKCTYRDWKTEDLLCTIHRGRILGRNWDKSLKSFPPCYSQSPLVTDFIPPPPSKSGLKLVCYVNVVYGNLKSENSKDYTPRKQKPQRNCTFMNPASGQKTPFQQSCQYFCPRYGNKPHHSWANTACSGGIFFSPHLSKINSFLGIIDVLTIYVDTKAKYRHVNKIDL